MSSSRRLPVAAGLATLSVLAFVLLPVAARDAGAGKDDQAAAGRIAHGEYLARIAGCNDCHTPGWDRSQGAVPAAGWLVGVPLGWRGAWGTTYAPNLRLLVADLSADEWLEYVRHLETRPPMPWYNLRAMSDEDLGALYDFVHDLGPAGGATPAFLPPGREPTTPFVLFPSP